MSESLVFLSQLLRKPMSKFPTLELAPETKFQSSLVYSKAKNVNKKKGRYLHIFKIKQRGTGAGQNLRIFLEFNS